MSRISQGFGSEKQAHLRVWMAGDQNQSLQQIWRKGKFIQFLIEIDKQHFQTANNLKQQISFEEVFQLMETYVTQNIGMKIQRKLRSLILHTNSFQKLAELLLFIAVHSLNKKLFIERILGLPSEIQTLLMTSIANLGQYIYTTDITEILQKIESLEIENQQLEDMMQEKDIKYQDLASDYQNSKQELLQAYKQLQSLKKQKSNALKQLSIDSIDQYIQIVRQLQSQCADNFKSLMKTEQRQKYLEIELANSKSKILQDMKIMSQLYEEIQSLKAICKNLRGSVLDQEPFSPMTQNVLKQNKLYSNTAIIQSPNIYRTKSVKQQDFHFDQVQEQLLRLRHQNMQYKNKLQTYYEIMQSQKQVILTYKKDIHQLKKCNEVRKWKLQELQGIHSDLSKLVFNRSSCQ